MRWFKAQGFADLIGIAAAMAFAMTLATAITYGRRVALVTGATRGIGKGIANEIRTVAARGRRGRTPDPRSC